MEQNKVELELIKQADELAKEAVLVELEQLQLAMAGGGCGGGVIFG